MGDLDKQRDRESTVCMCRGMGYITKAKDHKYVEKSHTYSASCQNILKDKCLYKQERKGIHFDIKVKLKVEACMQATNC